MKPSQRIYQQRDIAKQKMSDHAFWVARYMRSKDQRNRDRHLEEFTKWETIADILTSEGDIESGKEYKERKKKKQEHEKYEAARKRDAEKVLEKLKQPLVVEEKTEEVTRDKYFADYVQIQLNKYFATTSNTVTLNTNFPNSTTGMTYKFTIPRAPEVKVDLGEEKPEESEAVEHVCGVDDGTYCVDCEFHCESCKEQYEREQAEEVEGIV